MTEFRYKPWGFSIGGGGGWGRSGFPVDMSFPCILGSKSTVRPKMESCFQDGACSSVSSFNNSSGELKTNPTLGT